MTQWVLVPRKIGELELDFKNPTWKSNWDFEQFTVEFTVDFTNGFTTNFINYNITPKVKKQNKISFPFSCSFSFPFLLFLSFPFLPSFLPLFFSNSNSGSEPFSGMSVRFTAGHWNRFILESGHFGIGSFWNRVIG